MAKATAVRNIRDDHQKAFLKIFNSLCGRFNRWQVWQDFVMVTAIEISNATDKKNAPERTKTYQTIISKYSDAPHSIIYQRHQRYILNPDFRRIADTIIDTAPGEFPGRGMPLGVEPSQQEMAAMPSAVDNWIKCQMSTHNAGHYMDDYCIILPDIEDLKKLGRAIVRQFEIRGIPVNKKKCKIIPLTKPFRWCKARFTLTETGKIKVNGSRDGVIRARRKLKLFHREWLAGKRTLQEVAQYMNCQEAYYKNFDDHGRLLRLRRLCYAIFGGRVPCSKSSKPVMAPSLP